MKDWIVIFLMLIILMISHFHLASKIELLGIDMVVVQSQLGSATCKEN